MTATCTFVAVTEVMQWQGIHGLLSWTYETGDQMADHWDSSQPVATSVVSNALIYASASLSFIISWDYITGLGPKQWVLFWGSGKP